MKKKLTLNQLRITSFITSAGDINAQTIKGGTRAGCEQITADPIECNGGSGGCGGGTTGPPPHTNACPTEYCNSEEPYLCLTVPGQGC